MSDAAAVSASPAESPPVPGSADAGLVDALRALWRGRWTIVVGTLVAGAVAAAIAMVLPAVYTARTTLLPPQPPPSLANAALGSLGSLGTLAGAAVGMRNPVDQYVGLLQSATVADRIVDAFNLGAVYGAKTRDDARRALALRTVVSVGRRDGLVTIEVDDGDPKRAAQIAARYVDELRRLANELSLTEAQQRRKFFDEQLRATRDRLVKAQAGVQARGVNQGLLRAEPRVAAESYVRASTELAEAELRLRSLRVALSDAAPEVQQQLGAIAALRARVTQIESSTPAPGKTPASAVPALDSTAYLAAVRDAKHEEQLYEMYARQFELARVDEAREGTVVQVVDAAAVPERRSWPRRTLIVLQTMAAALVLTTLWVLARHAWRSAAAHGRRS